VWTKYSTSHTLRTKTGIQAEKRRDGRERTRLVIVFTAGGRFLGAAQANPVVFTVRAMNG